VSRSGWAADRRTLISVRRRCNVRVVRLVAAALLVAGLAGCAARRPAAAAPASPAEQHVDVSALIARGCFRCLERAFAAAERANVPQAFEAAVLLALRSKEIGLAYDTWLDRARVLSIDDSARAVFVEVAAAIPPDPLSGDRDVLLGKAMPRQQFIAASREWQETIADAPASDAFRQYVTLALACASQPFAQLETVKSNAFRDVPDVPLVRYRAAICGTTDAAALVAIQQNDPEFAELDYLLGQYSLLERPRPDYDLALQRLTGAAEAFPQSPAIRTVLGDVRQTREEWPEALEAYEEVIAMMPTHRDALLGRTIALSHLLRHDEAIDAATRVIDLGGWFMGQAYYWRAWNHFNIGNMPLARADIDRAKRLMVNASVFLLSGLVEWRARRTDSAQREFEQAQTLDPSACDATLYLGGVRAELGRLPGALTAFTAAHTCFEKQIDARRALIADINAGRGSESVKARLVQVQERAIQEAAAHREEAARNAAELQRRLQKDPA
jgi:tetratricopeptide (TPR) repeat protein